MSVATCGFLAFLSRISLRSSGLRSFGEQVGHELVARQKQDELAALDISRLDPEPERRPFAAVLGFDPLTQIVADGNPDAPRPLVHDHGASRALNRDGVLAPDKTHAATPCFRTRS